MLAAGDVAPARLPRRGDQAMGSWVAAAPAPGASPCAACKAPVRLPGVCDACARKADEEEHAATLAFARGTIPERFRWAALDATLLDQRVDPAAIDRVRGLFGAALPVGVALLGPAGSGKSTLACAILRRIHDRATFGCDPAIHRRARGAFFVSASELATDVENARREHRPSELRRTARNATVLVLDEVSKGGEAAWEIVQLRHDRNVPTIVTSWETHDELAMRFGGGFARRAGLVIECRKRR
jgi:DNA replication protein DnaC